MIYQQLGLLENQFTLNIHAKVNIRDRGNIYFSPVPLFDDYRLREVIAQTISCPYLPMLELFVDIIPHISSNTYVPTGDNLPGSSTQSHCNAPSQNIPHYQQPIDPYHQSNWNIPQDPSQDMPQYQGEEGNFYYVSEPQDTHQENSSQPFYVSESQDNTPQENSGHQSNYVNEPEYNMFEENFPQPDLWR